MRIIEEAQRNDKGTEIIMNKHNLMRKIASVATELDYVGLTKEAKTMDLMLLKLAQSPVAAPGSDDDGNDVPDKYNPEFKFQADDDKAFSPEKWSKIRNLIKSIYESIKSVSYMKDNSFFEKVYAHFSNKGLSEKAIERDMMYLQRWKELLINTEMILSELNTEYEDAFFKDFNKLFQTWNVGYREVMEYGGPEFLTTKKPKQDVRNMQISSKLNDIAEIIGWDNVDLLPWEENPELAEEMFYK